MVSIFHFIIHCRGNRSKSQYMQHSFTLVRFHNISQWTAEWNSGIEFIGLWSCATDITPLILCKEKQHQLPKIEEKAPSMEYNIVHLVDTLSHSACCRNGLSRKWTATPGNVQWHAPCTQLYRPQRNLTQLQRWNPHASRVQDFCIYSHYPPVNVPLCKKFNLNLIVFWQICKLTAIWSIKR